MIDRRLADEVRARVRAQAGNRCGYCLSPQHLVLGLLEIDHIIPKARGGTEQSDRGIGSTILGSSRMASATVNPADRCGRFGAREL